MTKRSSGAKIGKKELKLVTSEINTYYHKRYAGKSFGTYYSGTYSKKYRFKINGYADYHFVKAEKIK